MTGLAWFITPGINAVIVVAGLVMARETVKASDWFLAGRTLPWWMVGLSMFATAVDSGDYAAAVGGAYTFGLSSPTTWWLGLPIGWFIVANIVFPPMCRTSFFTNAEYLEYRFGPATVGALGAIVADPKGGSSTRFSRDVSNK
jgi:Na+/proline symporter